MTDEGLYLLGLATSGLEDSLRADKFDSIKAREEIKKILKQLDNNDGITQFLPGDLAPPWIIKTIQPTSDSNESDRRSELIRTNYNIFQVKASTIKIDLLTDSGTGAQSDKQWAAIMTADERYAHSETYEAFIPIAQRIFLKEYVLPVHQGRTAENLVFECLLKQNSNKRTGPIVCLGNSFFDTTAGNCAQYGALEKSIDCPESLDTNKYYDFKGNTDIEGMENLILQYGPENIGFIIMTVVNNTIGGQPVSLHNLRRANALAKKYNLLFLLDSARIFENAYFIQQREKDYSTMSIQDIVHEMTSMADIVLMSGKKDAIVNMGGLIATNNLSLYEKFRTKCILIEGHYSYGGMSGRDLAALTQGLQEGINYKHLRARINQITELGNGFRRLGIPIQWPAGSNGVFVDARKFLPNIPWSLFPAQSLCIALYERYGIRAVEIGLSLSPRNSEGFKKIPENDFVRLTIPRRVYSQEHLNYVLWAFEDLAKKKDSIPGLFYEEGGEGDGNGHFTSKFRVIPPHLFAEIAIAAEEYFKLPLKRN